MFMLSRTISKQTNDNSRLDIINLVVVSKSVAEIQASSAGVLIHLWTNFKIVTSSFENVSYVSS